MFLPSLRTEAASGPGGAEFTPCRWITGGRTSVTRPRIGGMQREQWIVGAGNGADEKLGLP